MGQKVTLNYEAVIELKNEAQEHFTDKIHFHDACGGQYFTLETKNEMLATFIEKYFAKQNIKAVFSDDGLNFSLEK